MTGPIVIYGASGTAGALVAGALVARGAAVVLAGRDRARLRAIAGDLGHPPIAVAAAHDPAALRQAFRGAKVVVGCAGPFDRLGHAASAAALAVGAHWVDLARDQAYLRALFEEHDAAARQSRRAVVGGLGVEVGLGDWAARVVAGLASELDLSQDTGERWPPAPPIDELAVGYAFDELSLAPGAQRSWIATLCSAGVRWRNHRWDIDRAGARALSFEFGELGTRIARSFPGGEIATVPRHVDVATLDTFAAIGGDAGGWYERAGSLAARGGRLAGAALEALLTPLVDPTRVPTAEQRRRARFAVVARARRGERRAELRVSGVDLYAATARIAAEAALALAHRDDGPCGVLTPAQAFGAAARLRALADAGAIRVDGPT